MIVKSLELSHFRNYDTAALSLEPGTNIFYGDNAQGKTNILEAICLGGTTKSHRGSRDKEMIQFGFEESHIRLIIQKPEKEYQIDMHLKRNRAKGIAVDRIPIKKASELFGILNIVLFSPEDLNIIKNGPAARRHFMDAELCQLDKIYLDNLSRYNRVLSQRNKLLKDVNYKPGLKDTLCVWDMQLLEYGRKVIRRRREFVYQLNEIVTGIHQAISGGKETLILTYDPNTQENLLEQELNRTREKDLKSGLTTVGPHRDDMSFFIGDMDIRKYGSQGQQRTSALSLKLSEIALVKNVMHDAPVLLLDDVLSELDGSRQNYLLDHINSTQTIITCTGLDEFIRNRFQMNRVFEVTEGKVSDRMGGSYEH